MTRLSRHSPQRTCVVCRVTREKVELIRIVRQHDGQVIVDEKGKEAGRGAYLCRKAECQQKASQGKQLERALGSIQAQVAIANYLKQAEHPTL